MATIKDYKRMCKYYKKLIAGCFRCPLHCDLRPRDFPDNVDEIIDKWVQEHPAKTYADDFFEKFPNAQLDSYGAPRACVNVIYGLGDCSKSEISGIICRDCWNQKMKD